MIIFDSIGYYLIFLFKVLLSLISSLMLYSLFNKKFKSSLKFYSIISIAITTLISVANHSSFKAESLNFLLPFMVLSLFMVISRVLFSKDKKQTELLFCFLLIAISIPIGLGYYFSSITLLLISYIINYSFDGILDFFNGEKELDVSEGDDLDVFDLLDQEQLLENDKESE